MITLTEPGADWHECSSGLWIPPGHTPEPPPRRPIAVDLFAGCGGFSLGFVQSGWHVAAALEHDHTSAATYLTNLGSQRTIVHTSEHPHGRSCGPEFFANTQAPGEPAAGTGWIATSGPDVDAWPCEHFWQRDITTVSGTEILDALNLQPGQLDAVFGGPPCQGFSTAGKRQVADPRNTMVFEFARLIRELRPKTFAMENVPAMLSMVTPAGIPVVEAFCRQLSDADYGDYETLLRSLKQSAGVGVGTGYDPKPAHGDERPTEQQPDLFGGALT